MPVLPPPECRTASGIFRDILAGVTLASVNIPQVLGYTRIAALPAVSGLFAALLPPVAFALFGSSRHLVVSADSATAAILSGSLTPLATPGSLEYQLYAGMVALLCAGFLLLARIFRLGFLADFLSRTVLMGFLAGVGIQVAITMLPEMLGIPVASHSPPVVLAELARHLPGVQSLPLLLTSATLLFIVIGRRLFPRFPAPLIAVIVAILVSKDLCLDSQGVATIGAVAGGLPHLHIPLVSWDKTLALLPVAGSCVFIIIAQSIATSRSYAALFHEDTDANADILGLSAANFSAAVSGAFVVNGSPTQTATAVSAGARSQVAQLTFSAITLCVLLFFTGPLEYLPRCVLSAIVFLIAVDMIRPRDILAIRQESPGEYHLALITAAAVVCAGVQPGIFLAIALSLFRHVRHSYEPHTLLLREDPQTHSMETLPARPGEETAPGLLIYRFSADLFYANCTRFSDDIQTLIGGAPHPVRCIVIDASAITDIDYSAAESLRTLLRQLHDRNITVCFGRVSPWLLNDMTRHRIAGVAGPDTIFPTLHQAVSRARAVLAAAPS